jgi:hypothetical protein
MADEDVGVTGMPLYIGADPNGGHQILLPDGTINTVPTEGLTPDLQAQAIKAAQPALPPAADDGSAPFNPDTAIANAATGAGKFVTNLVTGGLGNPAPTPAAPPAAAGQPPAPAAAPDTGGTPPPATAPVTAPAPAPAPGGGGGGGPSVPGLSDLNQGSKDTLAGMKATADDKTKLAAEQLPLQQQQAKDQAARADAFQLQQAAIQRQGMDMLAKAQAAADDYAHSSIDPAKKTSLMSGLALIIGGAGAGFNGQANPIMKQLQDRQEQDLARQKFNIEHKKDASDEYQKLYNNFRSAGMDSQSSFTAVDNAIKSKDLATLNVLAAAHAGPQIAAQLQQATGGYRDQLATEKANIFKSAADTHLANTTAAHTAVETAGMKLAQGNSATLKDAQNEVQTKGFWGLTPDKQRALVSNAAGNKMLINGMGIASREVQPDEQQKAQDMQLASKTLDELDHIASNPTQYKQAESYAQTLQIVLPKLFGAQSRLNLGAQEAVGNMVANNPAGFTRWKAQSEALHNTLGNVRQAFTDNLGLIPTAKPVPRRKTPVTNG